MSDLTTAQLEVVLKLCPAWLPERREKWNGYHVTVGKFVQGDSFIATAVRHRPVADGHPLAEPGDLWFEYADLPDEALAKLKRSLVH